MTLGEQVCSLEDSLLAFEEDPAVYSSRCSTISSHKMRRLWMRWPRCGLRWPHEASMVHT